MKIKIKRSTIPSVVNINPLIGNVYDARWDAESRLYYINEPTYGGQIGVAPSECSVVDKQKGDND